MIIIIQIGNDNLFKINKSWLNDSIWRNIKKSRYEVGKQIQFDLISSSEW